MSRHYCFTSFADNSPRGTHSDIRYLVFQRETSPETYKEHWQGYVEFVKPKRVLGAQTALGLVGAHMEVRKGTRDQARAYCMKEESRLWGPYEIGEWKTSQGKRTDIESVAAMVKKSCSDQEIAFEFPSTFMRMHKGIGALRAALCEDRTWKTEVTVYWSAGSGTGKSLLAHEELPNAYCMTDAKGWWDGYDGQDEVIIDDFRPEWMSCSFMLNLLDRYPMRVPIKGSSAKFVARKIIITSNLDPEGWYPEQSQHIMRRIDYCECLD